MFEDATFESNNKIRTRSRFWIIAALVCNSSILLTLILIPLIYPDALGHQEALFLMQVPPPPPQQTPPQHVQPHERTVIAQDPFAAPTKIPRTLIIPDKPEPPGTGGPINIADLGTPGGMGDGMPPGWGNTKPVVAGKPDVRVMRVSSNIVAGMLLRKTIPEYPAIAKAAHIEGIVVLDATISKNGAIENLHVVSGQPMLQQSALNAVKTWIYRPYLLNGEPVEVQTTVNVIFSLGH